MRTYPDFCAIGRSKETVVPGTIVSVRLGQDWTGLNPRGLQKGVAAIILEEAKCIVWRSTIGP